MKKLSSWRMLCLLSLTAANISVVNATTNEYWTLPKTVERILQQAPEVRSAQSELNSSRHALEQSDAWKNPSLELEANNGMGIDDGQGGYDLTRIGVTQSLDFSQRAHRREVAELDLKSKEARYQYQTLLLQNQAAMLFHDLQLKQAEYQLAEEELRFADEALNGKKSDPVVRYLHPAEKIRLGMLREQAQQVVLDAKLEWEAVRTSFCRTLNIADNSEFQIEPLEQLPVRSTSVAMEDQWQQHPALLSSQYEKEAAQAQVALTKAERLDAPELTLYQERDVIGGTRENVTGIAISMQIPVWNQGSSGVAKAKTDAERITANHEVLQRDLQTTLKRQQARFSQRLTSASQYKNRILEPADKLLRIIQKSFAAGDANVLELVDAYSSYFDARKDYLNLLHDTWTASADLALAAGLPLLTNKDSINAGEKQ